MKNIIFTLCVFALGLSLVKNASAQMGGLIEGTTISTVAPFTFSGTVSSEISPSTSHAIQFKAAADVEQYKDDFPALHQDMQSGLVKSIADIKQPALKELFLEVSSSEEQMKEIDSAVAMGSELQRVAAVVEQILFSK